MSETPVCRFFQKNQCRNGVSCKFRHDKLPTPQPQVCPYHVTWKGCRKGDDCKDAHPYTERVFNFSMCVSCGRTKGLFPFQCRATWESAGGVCTESNVCTCGKYLCRFMGDCTKNTVLCNSKQTGLRIKCHGDCGGHRIRTCQVCCGLEEKPEKCDDLIVCDCPRASHDVSTI